MSSFGRSLLIAVISFGLSAPAFAQMNSDAGSGPTTGAVSTKDAGSGPTPGAKPKTGSTTASNSSHSTNSTSENSAGASPGPKSSGGSQPVTPGMSQKQ